MPEIEKIIWIAILAVVALSAIIIYFVASLIGQHRRITQWQQQRIKAEVETLEAERKRIATNLHDEIGPMLSAIKLQINHVEPTDETDKIILQKSSRQINEVIQHFRDVSFNLLPNTLVRSGIAAATDELINRLPDTKLMIEFVSENIVLKKEDEINVFRIIQEIIHNTIKHARATRLTIEIKLKPPVIVLQSADDGIGFTYTDKMKHSNGIGLLSIQSRVEILNATMQVTTAVGMGTKYLIEIPTTN